MWDQGDAPRTEGDARAEGGAEAEGAIVCTFPLSLAFGMSKERSVNLEEAVCTL